MKQIFNFLAKKSVFQPTLGYVLLRPFSSAPPAHNSIFNVCKFTNGGRIAERAVFLSACFAAAAALPLAAPITASTVFLGTAAMIGAKTAGILAGKVTDFIVNDINSRVIPRREAKKRASNQT